MTDPTPRADLLTHRAPPDLLGRARERRHVPARRRSPGSLALAAAALLAVGFVAGRGTTSTTPVEAEEIGATDDAQADLVTVRFVLHAADAHDVSVTGTWNDWAVDIHRLERVDSGVFVGEIDLPRGQHEYMFVVDGETWVADPNAAHSRDDGFGQRNSVLEV